MAAMASMDAIEWSRKDGGSRLEPGSRQRAWGMANPLDRTESARSTALGDGERNANR